MEENPWDFPQESKEVKMVVNENGCDELRCVLRVTKGPAKN